MRAKTQPGRLRGTTLWRVWNARDWIGLPAPRGDAIWSIGNRFGGFV